MKLAAGAAISLALAATPSASSADASSDYVTGYTLGHQAYEYGLPLLDTERVYRTETSVNVSDGAGDGPVNQFNSVGRLVTTTKNAKTIVAPNHDTLYSMAWLHLRHGPVVIHVPAIKRRFFVIALYSPWTENFYNVTSDATGPAGHGDYGVRTGGDYAVVPRGWNGRLPAGVKRIRSRYPRVWIIGRTLIRGESDLAAVRRIQRGYTVTPLSKYGKRSAPKRPRHPARRVKFATVPGTKPGDDPLAFYTALDRELERFGPEPGDGPLLGRLKAIDVGLGMDPAHDPHLSAATLQGMRDAVTEGPASLQSELTGFYVANSQRHNGYLVVRTGTYGSNYRRRAIVDHVGLGAPTPDISIYPLAQTDHSLHPLTGAKSYVLHLPPGRLPPVHGFWSLTVYDLDGYLVPNALHRYLINDRSDLHHNPDGSINIYVQHKEPSDPLKAQNWLPAPAGDFRLLWRLYDTEGALRGILDGTGWQPPVIETAGTFFRRRHA